MCLVHEFDKKKNTWELVAQTEVKNDDLNPDFGAVKLKYWFEKK